MWGNGRSHVTQLLAVRSRSQHLVHDVGKPADDDDDDDADDDDDDEDDDAGDEQACNA